MVLTTVDPQQYLTAFGSIKRHLPLLSSEEYFRRHGAERGFTSKEVEGCLKRLVNTKRQSGLAWDDVIDIFIVSLAKSSLPIINTGRNKFNSELTFNS